jgi:ABC-type glycerol-3-phosphate transport system substrate-binding protein
LQLFDRFINNYVDFENKVTYFDSDEFNNNLDAMYKMVKLSKENTVKSLFDDLYINRSFPLITGNYAYYKSIDENPVVCRGLIENDKVYSSFVQIGFAVNNNTKYKKQIYEFIKYALSDEVQMKMCGAIGNSYSASTAFPVNKKAFEQSKYVASTRTDDDEKIIGIENDFVSSYIDVAEKINKCTLYMNVSNSYYNSSIIGDIVDSYLNDDISKEKFIRQLTAATEIYLTE